MESISIAAGAFLFHLFSAQGNRPYTLTKKMNRIPKKQS
jgi:hypothetical protein